jgi:hypothetical protein
MRNEYKILVEKSEANRPFRKAGYRWEDNIEIDLKETECDDVVWIQLAKELTV